MSSILRESTRTVKITPNINPYSAGSALVEFGKTKVHVTASVEESLPKWLQGKGQGWVTAEYSMLPGSTLDRSRRERAKLGGRTQEIQRFLGRSLRSIIDLALLGEKSIILDCDVLVADGGTRTASLSGAYVALKLAINKLIREKVLFQDPMTDQLAAISVGITPKGDILADLNYLEDSSCETDMNIVMTRTGNFIEIQGTAEGSPFTKNQLQQLLQVSESALQEIFTSQDKALKEV